MTRIADCHTAMLILLVVSAAWTWTTTMAIGGGGSSGSAATVGEQCPSVCQCKWKGGKQTVECIDKQLITIPESIDQTTQVLDMSGNNLQQLPRETFIRLDLLNLQKLFLRNCRLGHIDEDAFKGLTNLVELDLSHNLLTSIPSNTFLHIPSLRDVTLSKNPIAKIEPMAFRTVPSLVKLDLSHCDLTTIAPQAFEGLDILHSLKLNGNKLSELRPRTVETLSRLHGVELHDNPWLCDCRLRAAKIWLTENNIPYPVAPVCAGGPPRIIDRTFDDLQVDDFACRPEMLPVSRFIEAFSGENATLNCRTGALPSAQINWYWNGRQLVNNTSFSAFQRVHIYERGEFEKASQLVITNAQDSDSSEFYCVAENRAGAAEANFTLHVTMRAGISSFGNGQIAGLSIALVVLILCILLIILFLLVRLRRMPFSESKSPGGQLDTVITTVSPTASHLNNINSNNVNCVGAGGGGGGNNSNTVISSPNNNNNNSINNNLHSPNNSSCSTATATANNNSNSNSSHHHHHINTNNVSLGSIIHAANNINLAGGGGGVGFNSSSSSSIPNKLLNHNPLLNSHNKIANQHHIDNSSASSSPDRKVASGAPNAAAVVDMMMMRGTPTMGCRMGGAGGSPPGFNSNNIAANPVQKPPRLTDIAYSTSSYDNGGSILVSGGVKYSGTLSPTSNNPDLINDTKVLHQSSDSFAKLLQLQQQQQSGGTLEKERSGEYSRATGCDSLYPSGLWETTSSVVPSTNITQTSATSTTGGGLDFNQELYSLNHNLLQTSSMSSLGLSYTDKTPILGGGANSNNSSSSHHGTSATMLMMMRRDGGADDDQDAAPEYLCRTFPRVSQTAISAVSPNNGGASASVPGHSSSSVHSQPHYTQSMDGMMISGKSKNNNSNNSNNSNSSPSNNNNNSNTTKNPNGGGYPADYGLPVVAGAEHEVQRSYRDPLQQPPGMPTSAKTLRVWQRGGVPVLPPVTALKRALTNSRNSPDEGYQEGCGTDV